MIDTLRLAAVSAAAVIATALAVQAQTPTNAAAPPPYRPGLGDLMTMTVQPRHLKLGIAGREANWPYATYELHQLEEALERVTRTWPEWRRFSMTSVMEVTREPITALSTAIKAHDSNAFNDAYGLLTEACNSCHQVANVGVNVIVVPDASPFANQDFRPTRR